MAKGAAPDLYTDFTAFSELGSFAGSFFLGARLKSCMRAGGKYKMESKSPSKGRLMTAGIPPDGSQEHGHFMGRRVCQTRKRLRARVSLAPPSVPPETIELAREHIAESRRSHSHDGACLRNRRTESKETIDLQDSAGKGGPPPPLATTNPGLRPWW